MTHKKSGEEREHQVERYRLLAQEVTDPLAAFLLRDIQNWNLILQKNSPRTASGRDQKMAPFVRWSAKRRPA